MTEKMNNAPPSGGLQLFHNWFFEAPVGERSVSNIIVWWEVRRIPYNLIVGLAGLCSLCIFYFCIDRANVLAGGEDAVEPLALIAAPFIINICYTAGWLTEISMNISHGNDLKLGPRLLKYGLIFSLAIVFFPALAWAVVYISRLIVH